MPAEKVRLRIGNLANAVLISGQAYQDPKDALNEFVSNAADDYAEAGRKGERIRVVIRRRGRYPGIAIDEAGRGMSPDRLREVARSLFDSSKAGDRRTLGEKAIGMLAFQQLGGRCDIVSRAEGSAETWALHLERGQATASLERERRRARLSPGTTVYVSDLDPDVIRVLTQRKVVMYLRARRAAALLDREYEIEVVEGRTSELVEPEQPDGVRLAIPARHTLAGRIEFSLYVAPNDGKRRRVAVVGTAGTSVVEDLTEIEEFGGSPWDSNQVSGRVIFEALQQTAGRRAVLRDRVAFPLFVSALQAIEPLVTHTVERVRMQVDAETADRMSDAIRRIFNKVLKELADLDNPMRSPTGSEPGEGGLFQPEPSSPDQSRQWKTPNDEDHRDDFDVRDLDPPPIDSVEQPPLATARPSHSAGSRLPTLAPDLTPGDGRSRFDPELGVVFFNDRHPDYLMVKDSEAALLDYLATLVAKELVVFNNPRAAPVELGEELVRMLVRVRRHLPRRV